MRTVQIHECHEPGCGAQTIYRYCPMHEPAEQRAARLRLQAAMDGLAQAEGGWLQASWEEDPVAIHTAEQRWRSAQARVDHLESELGMIR